MKLTLPTHKTMRITRAALLAGLLATAASCEDFLDVNNNPNGPDNVTANLYLPQMLHWMATAPSLDGRYMGQYTQMWMQPASGAYNNYDIMGYTPRSDAAGETWRTVYWLFGQNLVDMIGKAEAEQRWDLLGVGMMLKGWGWMQLAGLHGDIIVKQAIDQTRFSFDYDTEEYAYQEAKRLLDSAIVLLRRTDGAVDATYLAKGDRVYNGSRELWLRYTYGLRAMMLNRYSNKAVYNADAVIADVDSALAVTGGGDMLFPYPATQATDDRNFWGPSRQNLQVFRQTRFILELMDGTQFGTADPRMSRMLVRAPDGVYRGLHPSNQFYGGLAVNQRPNNLFDTTATPTSTFQSRFLFSDKTKWPVMTRFQLQFVKAEAAFRKGDRATAYTAYLAGINGHFDFINLQVNDDGKRGTPISAAERTAYLAGADVSPGAAGLTMSHIMSQKFIAQWAWGFYEQWMDMRRFLYTGRYGAETLQAFRGFTPPTTLYADNGGEYVYRFRPRYNSEYVWNLDGLGKITPISGTAANYQTSKLWIIQP